jgi:hypothetical protein
MSENKDDNKNEEASEAEKAEAATKIQARYRQKQAKK